MQRIRSLALILTILGGIVVLAAAPVAAESGPGGGGDTGGGGDSSGSSSSSGDSSSSSSGSTDNSESESSSTSDKTETETEGSGDHGARDLLKQLRQDAKDSLKKMREAEHGTLTEHGRQLVCEKRQDNINTRVGNISDAAQRHLNVFTGIFTKVQSFHATKGLSVSNYDSLVATATAKQTAAQAAVEALKTLDVNIDCSQPDPAQTLETVKTAVSTARSALQDYRKAIKDLIVAISGALDSQDTTAGGDQ